jgi:Asp-tRNA(Asn)/Glu-tRNA(Gln) amidotransferase A subunit family amidase
MSDQPWDGDACSLVDAFRSGSRSPVDELHATLGAIERSDLNAFSFLDVDRADAVAAAADVSKPFGGVPTGIKELEQLEGWPDTEASLVFKDRRADHTSVHISRLLASGANPVGLTTASEFGGLNVSVTKLNGVTRNPWNRSRTVGGSSGGSAAAVAGGLVSLACGGDGGGSIRIPAGYTGLLGMKGTFGRIPRSPNAYSRPNTVVLGNLARSVRDAARYFDVCGGVDSRDPTSLPRHPGFEAGLGSHDLRGRRVAVVPSLGGVTLDDGVETHLRNEADALIAETGMVRVDLDANLPNFIAHWAMGNTSTLLAELGERWPGCAGDLTDEIATGMRLSLSLYNLHTAAKAENLRIELNETLATMFDAVDFIICSTNPGPAFAAEATTSNPAGSVIETALAGPIGKVALRSAFGLARSASSVATRLPNALLDQFARRNADFVAMGGLTVSSNVYGNPAVSIPAGTMSGLPVGMQVLGRHHEDDLLLDVALAVERSRPWPLVAPQCVVSAT